MTTDVMGSLPPVSWRGIPFPLSSIENSFTHDHVEHKFIYHDGMHVEATGRNGFNFHCRIPFSNGVLPGPGEGWAGQTLYPDLFRKFILSVFDKSSGEFVHPDLGPIKCKARDVSWQYKGQLRDGAEVSVRFYESNDDAEDISALLSSKAPGAAAMASAEQLDDEIEAAGTLPELSNDSESFVELMASFNEGTGSLGRVTSKLDNTNDALIRLDDVFYWPLRAATEDMRAAVITLDRSQATQNGQSREYIVPFGSSLPAIAIRLRVGTDDLVRMNPKLARDPYVREGTKIIYVPIKF